MARFLETASGTTPSPHSPFIFKLGLGLIEKATDMVLVQSVSSFLILVSSIKFAFFPVFQDPY